VTKFVLYASKNEILDRLFPFTPVSLDESFHIDVQVWMDNVRAIVEGGAETGHTRKSLNQEFEAVGTRT
jgi:hypothetical protein